jgi:hypothetical protein
MGSQDSSKEKEVAHFLIKLKPARVRTTSTGCDFGRPEVSRALEVMDGVLIINFVILIFALLLAFGRLL